MLLPTQTIRFILHFARQQWFKFTLLIVSCLAWAINDAIFPYFIKRLVNALATYSGVPEKVYSVISITLLLIVLFWLIAEVLMRLQGITAIYLFPKFRANIRASVLEYVQSHSHDYFAGQLSGSVAKRLNDLPVSCQTITEIIIFQFITTAAGALLVLYMMASIHAVFAWILLTWLGIHLGLTFICLRKANQQWEIHAEAVSTLNGKVVDIFTNILNVRLFSRYRYERDYLQHFQNDEIKKSYRATWIVELMHIGLGINGLALIFSMIFALVHGWIQGWVSLGDFAQVGMQAFWLLGWVWYVSMQLSMLAREVGTVSDALQLVKHEHEIVNKENAHSLIVPRGVIEFKNVSFAYRNKKPLFSNLSFTIHAGEKVGIVGISGAGKSTLVNLILRFYNLSGGQILIDGQNIADVTQDSLREQIGMIPQDTSLFHRSLMDNIRYGRVTATDKEVIQAAKLAHCDEFIQHLDEGYQTMVGERGVRLSGGQRQRIAIARTILKNAPILILDEATSALDSVTEKLIQQSLYSMMQNKTTIVIAHRLATLSQMDRILVFKAGQLVEKGTKEDLLQANGHFALLWSMQSDGFIA